MKHMSDIILDIILFPIAIVFAVLQFVSFLFSYSYEDNCLGCPANGKEEYCNEDKCKTYRKQVKKRLRKD